MLKIGIISAMKNEFDEVLKIINKGHRVKKNLYQGNLLKKQVFIGFSGIGKVNAAIMATELIVKNKVDFLIIAGVGGAINKKINLFDVVISQKTSHFDFDLEIFGHKPGQVPNEPEKYLAYDLKNFESSNDIKFGEIISADHFITNKDIEKIEKKFPHALSVDMETSSVGQVAHRYLIPFLGIRVICDLIFQENNAKSYEKNATQAIEKLRNVVVDVLKTLS